MPPTAASKTINGEPIAPVNPPGSNPILAPITVVINGTIVFATTLSGDSSATRLPLVVAATGAGARVFSAVPHIFWIGNSRRVWLDFQKIFPKIMVERVPSVGIRGGVDERPGWRDPRRGASTGPAPTLRPRARRALRL